MGSKPRDRERKHCMLCISWCQHETKSHRNQLLPAETLWRLSCNGKLQITGPTFFSSFWINKKKTLSLNAYVNSIAEFRSVCKSLCFGFSSSIWFLFSNLFVLLVQKKRRSFMKIQWAKVEKAQSASLS